MFPFLFLTNFNRRRNESGLESGPIMPKMLSFFLLLALVGCAGTPEQTARAPGKSNAPAPVNFSGHWEMDYGRSDDVNHKLRAMAREWQRQAERRAQGDRRAGLSINTTPRAFNAVIASARLAEMITESQVLEIIQSDVDIEIHRDNTFTLTCVFAEGEPEVVIDELGSELCGWDANNLVFLVQLPDGLNIRHRVTMAEDGDRLRVTTTIDSSSAPPFTLNRFYFRFNPLPEDYSCEYTLSRGNVCQRGPS